MSELVLMTLLSFRVIFKSISRLREYSSR